MGHWERHGECPPERCKGRCCTHIGAWYDDTPENRAFVRTLQVRGISVKGGNGKFLVDLPQRCQWLTEQGLCALHPSQQPPSQGHPRRPEFCERWPEEPSQTINDPYCGFRFEWVEDDVLSRGEAVPVPA